jgi:hypothetical protein
MIPGKLSDISKLMLVVGFGLVLMVHTVSAAEPHFSGIPTISKTPDLTLTAKFKASSFGKRVVTVNLSGISHSQLQCVSPSRYSPAPKKVDFIKMQNQTLIIKPQDGKIKGYLTLGAPTVPLSPEICPNKNWSVSIMKLTFENVTLQILRKNSDILKFDYGNVVQ